MRYETMGRNRVARLNVPQFLGGLNTAVEPSLIEDDELADVCNLTPDHGALVTRGAVRAVGETPLTVCAGQLRMTNEVLRQPLYIDEELCTVILSSASDNNTQDIEVIVQVVSLDGVCKASYTMTTVGANYTFAVAPCDKKRHGAAFLLYHHGNVYAPDDASQTMKQVGADKLYAPLVMINAQSTAEKPSYKQANGVMYEGFNALTSRYRAQFTPSVAQTQVTAEYYAMPTKLLRNTTVTMEILLPVGACTVSMQVEGDAVGFQVGAAQYTAQAFGAGYVTVSPALPTSALSGTVTVTAERTDERTENGTQNATLATWFGGTQNVLGGTRLFLGGFGNAKLMWSDVNDPFYFPENNYLFVGDLSGHVKALEKQGDMLVIFKERELFYTTYVQGSVSADAVANGTNVDVTAAQAYFPLTQLSPNIGCRCPQSIALCRDRLVWMDEDARVYTLVLSGAYSERNVREIGQKLRPYLLEHTTAAQRKAAYAMDHRGRYRVLIGGMMAEFDYNDSGFVNVTSYASGERASRRIAWFVHRFDGFADNAAQCIISDGGNRALLIDTFDVYPTHKVVRMLYAFDAEGDDRYVYFDDTFTAVITEQPIVTTLTTKTYELGDPAAYKRIRALFWMMRTDGAAVRSIPDGELPVSGRWYQSDDLQAHLMMPAVKRCQTIAFRVDSEGTLCLKGLRLQYSSFGTVR